MTQAVARILEEAQVAEVQRRIAEIESGGVKLIPSEQVLGHVRELVASASAAN